MNFKIGGVLILSVMTTVLTMQNCAKDASFTAMSTNEIVAANSDAPGDYGSGGGGFKCVPGQKLRVYLDPDTNGVIVKENYLGSVVSYTGSKDAATNYNYYSASAHPLIGPKPIGFNGNIFFYDDGSGLALNLFSNIDNGGSTDNQVDVDIAVEGNNLDDSVLLSDDDLEIKEVQQSLYHGRFHYWSNTDGGVIGPLNADKPFVVKVGFLATGDVHAARFYSANGFSFSLNKKALEVSSFIIVNDFYETCKKK